jgi:hypothetical protein
MLPDVQTSSPTGATVQYNTVQLNDQTRTITGISPNGVSVVSQGQQIFPATVKLTSGPSGNLFELDVYAGRQDSSPVADQFNALCGGAAFECCTTTNIGNSPGELNFFFGVNISLVQPSTGLTSTVTAYIGQGSNDWGENNWWIGGPCIADNGVLSAWFGNDLVCVPFSATSDNAWQFSNMGGPTLQNNVVTFLDNSKTIVGVSLSGEPVVTNGQPMNLPPTVTPNITPASNGFMMELDAGRSGSGAVADAFNSVCGGAANEWGIGTATDNSPGELNFYFAVDIKLQVGADTSIETVYLGQGSAASLANNWWIGGSCISSSGQLSAVVGGQTVTLDISNTGANGFIFSGAADSAQSE